MGALCCAHNRATIHSAEEEKGLTEAEDDDDLNIELEYPDDDNSKNENINDEDKEIDKPSRYLSDSLENSQCALCVAQIIKYYISWISKLNDKKSDRIKDKDKDKGMWFYIHKTFPETYSQYNYTNVQLINDFNHILFKHYNEISSILSKFNIETNDQVNNFIFARNNRNRSEFQESMKMYFGYQQNEEIISQQLCDKIYCFLFDPVNDITMNKVIVNVIDNEIDDESKTESKNEMGLLIRAHDDDDDNDEYDENIVINKQLQQIQNELRDKKINFRKLRGFERINDKNKFVTNHNGFGYRYYYWPYYENKEEKDLWNIGDYEYKDWYINKKFSTLKEEILNLLNLIQFNILYKTATNYLNCNHCKQEMKCNTVSWEVEYEINKGEAIKLHHLICILLICNYDLVRDKLLKTYYEIPKDIENIQSLKQRHSEFYHIAKYLRETVECYGFIDDNKEDDDKKDADGGKYFYHSINESVIINDKIINIKYPFSVTDKYKVIYLNTNNENGLILSLNNNNIDNNNNGNDKYFDCKWISDFIFENEYFYVGGFNSFNVNTIISCKNGLNHNYEIYWNSLFILKNLFNGKFYKYGDKNNVNKKYQEVSKQLITNKMYNHYTESEILPNYIKRITNNYFESSSEININYKSIKEIEENGGYKFLSELLLNTNDFISIDIFKLLFPNLKEIIVDYTDCNKNEYRVDSRLFSYILLYLKSINNWHEIIVILPDGYDQDKLHSTINSFSEQFKQFSWTLNRSPYQNRITIINTNAALSKKL